MVRVLSFKLVETKLKKVKFLKFVLCISFLSISTIIYGQDYTLTVKVVDQSDNSPLDGVTFSWIHASVVASQIQMEYFQKN